MSFNSSKISALTGAAGATGATGASGGGSGDVVKVATPVNNQVGVWTGDGTLEGDSDLIFDGTNLGIGAGSDPDHPLHIGTDDFVVTSAGLVGVGTVNPSDLLTLSSGDSITAIKVIDTTNNYSATFGHGNTYTNIFGDAAGTGMQFGFGTPSLANAKATILNNGDFRWNNASASVKMTWDASEEGLGLGTTSPEPGCRLDVNGKAIVRGILELWRAYNVQYFKSADGTDSLGWILNRADGTCQYVWTLGQDLLFLTTTTGGSTVEKMRITSDGALGFGGENFGTSGQVLTSAGSAAVPTWETSSGGGGGKVLQVLNSTATVADASATSATAAVSQAITPAADSNTVLVTAIANFSLDYDEMNTETGDMRWQLFRGSVALGNEQKYVNNNDQMSWSANSMYFCCSFTFKDTPATASAETYSLKYYQANTNGPVAVVYDAQITVQEID
jgi:hypothetical protein